MGILSQRKAPPLVGSSTAYTEGWRTFSPVVYRYLPAEFVDAFFADGSLRLSSFSKCRTHADEQRLDREEGLLRLLMSDTETGWLRSYYEIEFTDSAYILCTTLWHNQQLMADFGCNSFIRIHDPAEFGRRIAAHIPEFRGGGEGPCMYQHLRIVEAALSTKPDEDGGSTDPLRAAKVRELIQRYALFLKHKAYSHQAEYRLVWMSNSASLLDHLDIKVPEVRELCSREGSFEHDSLGKPTAMR